MTSEADLVDLPLLPLERWRPRCRRGEPLDRVAHLPRRGVARSPEGCPFEDAEPDLDLVEREGVGRGEVELDVPSERAWGEVEPDDVGHLGGELRIAAVL